MATLEVSLVTPDGSAYEGEAEMLIVPGAAGEIGVLARHAPLVALLKAGSTRVHIKRGTEVREFATGPGFFKIEQDRALALVDDAVDVDEIDAARAQAQLEAARAETAALRALANGAQLLDDHPALAQLRIVQSLPMGATVELSLPVAD